MPPAPSPRLRARVSCAPGLMAVLLAVACAGGPKLAPPVSAGAFYWEATAPGGGALFLLGSVHIGDGRALELDRRVEGAWRRADALVVEFDPSAISPLDALDITDRHGLLPSEQTLHEIVSTDTYEALRAYLKRCGYPMQAADRMRPWLLARVVAQLEYQAAGYDAENGVDAWFLRRAAGSKPVIELESMEEQTALFASLPDSLQERLLREILRGSGDFVSTTREILQAWEQGDEARLGQLVLGSRDDPELADFYQRVFTERNQRMSERLAALAADGRARFVVIGTGHLIGAGGVPVLLADRGFLVKRIVDARLRAKGGAEAPKPGGRGAAPPPQR